MYKECNMQLTTAERLVVGRIVNIRLDSATLKDHILLEGIYKAIRPDEISMPTPLDFVDDDMRELFEQYDGQPVNSIKDEEHKKIITEAIQKARVEELKVWSNDDEGEEIELLSLLIEKYEQEHYPIEAPNPIEAIKFRMEQMNLKQSDVAPLFGGKTRVSEVLHGKRPLTLKMITLLNRYLGIPLESLVIGNKDVKLEPEKREKLLGIASIKDYISGSRAAMI